MATYSVYAVIRIPLPDISIPASLLFKPEFPAGVLLTLIQLVALSASDSASSSLSLQELSELTGKSQRTLSRHIHQLVSSNGLALRSLGQGRFSVFFPDAPSHQAIYPLIHQAHSFSGHPHPHDPKYPEFNSYFPEKIMGYISYQDDQDGEQD